MFKSLMYYTGYILVPILFLMNLFGNIYHSLKHSWYNAIVQTRSDIHSHKRYYKR